MTIITAPGAARRPLEDTLPLCDEYSPAPSRGTALHGSGGRMLEGRALMQSIRVAMARGHEDGAPMRVGVARGSLYSAVVTPTASVMQECLVRTAGEAPGKIRNDA